MTYTAEICTIVNQGNGERLAAAARKAGARGGTILVGRGTSGRGILRLLGLSDTAKDLLVTLVDDDQLQTVLSAIRQAAASPHPMEGISYVIRTGGTSMSENTKHELITVIVSRGYADDVMAAARDAGARGGTIVHARGTGKPDDEKFFGITIVPEKEQVLILAERESSQAIQGTIAKLPCLAKPGMGIMYTVPVDNFYQLGKKE